MVENSGVLTKKSTNKQLLWPVVELWKGNAAFQDGGGPDQLSVH